MSTIAYRDGILAADSMAYGGKYTASPGLKWKIWRLDNGDRLGVSSVVPGAGEAVRDWLNGKLEREHVPTDMVAIMIKGRDQLYVASGTLQFSGPIESEFYAIGGGADFAIGAMHQGADAAEAIRCAIAHDQHTGGEVRVLTDEVLQLEHAGERAA